MSGFKLKAGQPAFEIVDGPLAGRKFFPGEVYTEVPPAEAGRFEPVVAEKPKLKVVKKGEDES